MIAGTGTYSTAHSMHLTARAHELGVHGFLVVTPYYNKPPQRGIVEHFRAISEVSDRPIVAYNIPGRVVVNIEPETMAELAEIPTVTAVKQANDDLDQARRIVELGLDLYAGDDKLLLPFLGIGGAGGVCVRTHIVGPQMKEMVRRFRAGDATGARGDRRGALAAYELLDVASTRSRSRPRSTSSARTWAGSACRWCRPPRTSSSGCATASRGPG